MNSVCIALVLNAVNGGTYSLNMDILMAHLTKTPFTIFLSNLDLKGWEKNKANLVKAEMRHVFFCLTALRFYLKKYFAEICKTLWIILCEITYYILGLLVYSQSLCCYVNSKHSLVWILNSAIGDSGGKKLLASCIPRPMSKSQFKQEVVLAIRTGER